MVKKQLPEEFKEFIKCLNLNNVKYLLVGGWQYTANGYLRFLGGKISHPRVWGVPLRTGSAPGQR